MEKNIKRVKTIVIIVLILIVLFGLISNKLKNGSSVEENIVFYDSQNVEKSTNSAIVDTDLSIVDNEEKSSEIVQISINNASLDDLMKIKGIGETKAKAIIEYREKYNGFVSVEEIMQVKGIGEGTYNKIKDQICL